MIGLIDTHFHLDMYKKYDEIFQYLEVEKQYTLCMTNSPGIQVVRGKCACGYSVIKENPYF